MMTSEARGELLAFGGAIVGAGLGMVLGKKVKHEEAGAIAGVVGGIVVAHLVNTRVLPAAASGLGDVPPGFYEIKGGPKFDTDPVFTRGVVVPQAAWADQSRAHILTGAPTPEQKYLSYPHWTLYGGPMSAKGIDYVNGFLSDWADKQGYRYVPMPPALLVEPQTIAGGWPHTDFRFYQIGEGSSPHTVYLSGNPYGWRYA